jgi:hypothetical protein
MSTSLLPTRIYERLFVQASTRTGGVGRSLGLLIGALSACALMLAAPAGAATSCSTHGLTLRASGKASLQVVGLSAQGVSCAKATGVARRIARDLATGTSITLAGVSGIDVASSTPCANCATQTDVSLSYPAGSVNVSLKGATKLSASGSSAVPTPSLPFPRIPGFEFPAVPALPNFPTPVNPNSRFTTV